MVLQSELPFRMLVRRHDCPFCYSPMVPAKAFLALPVDGDPIDPRTGGPATQSAYFTTCEADRPLAVQLGGADPAEMLAAALLLQDRGVDCIDVNLGCPQQCAQTGGYGAFLLDEPERTREIVATLVEGLHIPVTAKVRIMPNVEDTIAFAKMLEDAGVAALAVHGRRREQRHHEGPASWEQIAAVKAALRIPVISNGNIRSKADVEACLQETGCDCVMSAKGLLSNPRLFVEDDIRHFTTNKMRRLDAKRRAEVALEYLDECVRHGDGCLPKMISDHLLEILAPDLERKFNADLKKEIKDHRKTTRPQQFASLVRRVQSNVAFAVAVNGREEAGVMPFPFPA